MNQHPFTSGQRVHLPWELPGIGGETGGHITAVEPHRFRVTWDRWPAQGSTRRPARQRLWYPASAHARFRTMGQK
jgi:hypothetical protein